MNEIEVSTLQNQLRKNNSERHELRVKAVKAILELMKEADIMQVYRLSHPIPEGKEANFDGYFIPRDYDEL